jgi:predicted nucleic acid-binding protein
VLDSWPVLEWLKDRAPAAARFEGYIEQAVQGKLQLYMSRINYGEVLYSVHKNLPKVANQATKAFLEIPIEFVSVDDALVDDAAALKSRYAISYADAFAAALALRLELPLATGDKDFLPLTPLGLQLLWLGA